MVWAISSADVAAIIAPFSWKEPAVTNDLTKDWTDDDLDEAIAVARDVGADPVDLTSCWYSESNLRTAARNPGDVTRPAVAVGLFQLTHAALGPSADLDAVRRETVYQQLQRARTYYGAHRGALISAGACYLCTFLPGYLAHASSPTFVLCSTTLHPEWYTPNRGAFDPEGKGYITVGDLGARIERVKGDARWREFEARLRARMQGADTLPEVNEMNRDTLFTLPDEDGPEAA